MGLKTFTAGLLAALVFFPSAQSFAAAPGVARQGELLNLLRHDCGSCHGLTLAGGLGLPLLPEALKGKSPDALRETILHGRGGTPMPPWRDFISAEEAAWLVEHLMKGLPDAR